MPEMKDGCVQPARGPILPPSGGEEDKRLPKSEVTMTARVGAEAPDFEAHAFIRGVGFKTVKLSDYKGRWIVVCFYPGDFTFV